MYIQHLSYIQGVYFISLTAMKASICHSSDRHRAQENIKGISYILYDFNFRSENFVLHVV